MQKILIAVFILLFTGINFVRSEGLVELTCLNTRDCEHFATDDVESVCDQGRCYCRLSNGIYTDCIPNVAKLNNVIGGPCPCLHNNSECNETEKICYCKEGFMASPDKRRCILNARNLGDDCETNEQCQAKDFFAICSREEKCVCKPNFGSLNGSCFSVINKSAFCFNDTHCETYGKNTVCLNADSVQKCGCARRFVRSKLQDSCIEAVSLQNNCTTDLQCQGMVGPGGACIDNICQCLDKYFPHPAASHYTDLTLVCRHVVQRGQYCLEERDCYEYHLPEHEQTLLCKSAECVCRVGLEASSDKKSCVKSESGVKLLPDAWMITVGLVALRVLLSEIKFM